MKGTCPWVLLATGTIDPKGMRFTVRTDPAQRLSDYTEALRFWCDTIDLPIVFCENSGYDLGSFSRLAKNRSHPLELVSFEAPPFPEKRGKGYGEVLIMKHAIENSALIGPETRVIKVTGRLQVANFEQIFARMSTLSFDVCLDLKEALNDTDCRFFAASTRFLRDYLVPEAERIDETIKPMINLERALASATLRAVADGLRWELLPVDPLFRGYSATRGNRYTNRRYLIRQASKAIRARMIRLGL